MRKLLLLLLVACGAPSQVADSGVDAGQDAGLSQNDAGRDAGVAEWCVPNGMFRYVRLRWTSDVSGTVCTFSECSSQAFFARDVMCRIEARYADAGCVVTDDGGFVTADIDCTAMCDRVQFPTCCTRVPEGAERQGCRWTPPDAG